VTYLKVDRNLCTGCRMCETACSEAKEGIINRARSRIRIYRRDVLQLIPKVCLQCPKPICLKVCPEKAIYRENGNIRVNSEKCTGCGQCTEACPCIFLAPEGDRALMCDQCGFCIPVCPEGALTMVVK
jgi:carbon-monoxide dehydrogenase iron sulfur subunit